MPRQQLHSWTHRWNQQIPEGKSFRHRNQTTNAIRSHHIFTKHPKVELKDFTLIDRESNTLHHQAKEALHIHIKDPSLNRNIGKVRIPSVFNKLLKPPRQLELSHSSIATPKGGTYCTWSFNKEDNTSPSWSPSTIEVLSLCSHLSNFKTTKPLDLHLQRNTQENSFYTSQNVIFSRKYLSFKFSGLLISSSNNAEEGTS